MSTLADARVAVAAVLSGLPDVAVRPRPTITAAPRHGDGWVVVTRVQPADFTASTATLTAVITLGSDHQRADERLDALMVPAVDALTASDLGVHGVDARPEVLAVDGGEIYALAITLSLAVTATA